MKGAIAPMEIEEPMAAAKDPAAPEGGEGAMLGRWSGAVAGGVAGALATGEGEVRLLRLAEAEPTVADSLHKRCRRPWLYVAISATACEVGLVVVILIVGALAPWWLPLHLPEEEEPISWYTGVKGIHVFHPGSRGIQHFVDSIYEKTKGGQFSDERHAILLKAGTYPELNIPVGYYTSVVGTGASQHDVQIQGFFTENDHRGVATSNFWRSVEGLTTLHKGDQVTWATSQACPLRRLTVQGDLRLYGRNGPSWSSGGFMADVSVGGTVDFGTQQQFFVRNSNFNNTNIWPDVAWNYLFLGVDRAPASTANGRKVVTNLPEVPIVAGKPFLVEDRGEWHMVLPPVRHGSGGRLSPVPPLRVTEEDGCRPQPQATRIDMACVYIVQEGATAAEINEGIASKAALLLTPAIFGLEEPIVITADGFAVLGLGFPTLVATAGMAALEVRAAYVRVAGVLLEAGMPMGPNATKPLLLWSGNHGRASDIFARVGAFKYQRPFHDSCMATRADVMVEVVGDHLLVDNTWFWHADHDDCPRSGFAAASDSCYSGHGLRVTGSHATFYALMVEHTMADLVDWQGERGRVFFYQSELPYHNNSFGLEGFCGYKVRPEVEHHMAVALGVYVVGQELKVPFAFCAPPTASITKMFDWTINGDIALQMEHLLCTPDGNCTDGDYCVKDGAKVKACYQAHFGASP